MIACRDAPSLAYALHKGLAHCRINRANPRKEFFRTDFESILGIVRANHGDIEHAFEAAEIAAGLPASEN